MDPAAGDGPFPRGDELRGAARSRSPRVDGRTPVARERRQQRRLVAEPSIDAHRIGAGCVAQLERAHHEPSDANDVDRGCAPCLAERVEPVLKEAGRRVEAAGAEALDDLLVEERVHLAIGVRRAIHRAAADRSRARERAELIEPVDRTGRVRPVGHEDGGAEHREAGEKFPRPANS